MVNLKNLANLVSFGIEDIVSIENTVAVEDVEGGDVDMNAKQREELVKVLEDVATLIKSMIDNSNLIFMTQYYRKLFLEDGREGPFQFEIGSENKKEREKDEDKVQGGNPESRSGKGKSGGEKGSKVNGSKKGDILPSSEDVEVVVNYVKKLIEGSSYSHSYGFDSSDSSKVSEKEFQKTLAKFENLLGSYIAGYRCVSMSIFSLLFLFVSLIDNLSIESEELTQFINLLSDSIIFEISLNEFN